ncbi:MAG: OmpH family outer membrane protein [Prevotellaceae bacterium]|nr:OmpH family outer membrane protein [Prevotellaceae bacterium]
MLKKLLLVALFAIPCIAVTAQTPKFGHVNSQEILMAMPEIATIEKEVGELGTIYENELLKLREEYNAKITEYQEKQATMHESIKQVRQGEIAEMEQRIMTFNQQASQDLQKKQQELLVPVIEKIKKAIDEIGNENAFSYIFDLSSQSVLYSGKDVQDITELVKTKLGIK